MRNESHQEKTLLNMDVQKHVAENPVLQSILLYAFLNDQIDIGVLTSRSSREKKITYMREVGRLREVKARELPQLLTNTRYPIFSGSPTVGKTSLLLALVDSFEKSFDERSIRFIIYEKAREAYETMISKIHTEWNRQQWLDFNIALLILVEAIDNEEKTEKNLHIMSEMPDEEETDSKGIALKENRGTSFIDELFRTSPNLAMQITLLSISVNQEKALKQREELGRLEGLIGRIFREYMADRNATLSIQSVKRHKAFNWYWPRKALATNKSIRPTDKDNEITSAIVEYWKVQTLLEVLQERLSKVRGIKDQEKGELAVVGGHTLYKARQRNQTPGINAFFGVRIPSLDIDPLVMYLSSLESLYASTDYLPILKQYLK